MEKKNTTSKRTIKEFPKVSRNVLPRQQDGTEQQKDSSSRLVGSIMEKGFASTTMSTKSPSLPRPTVLPFPVARHRSHGPHRAPISKDIDVMDIDDGNEDIDNTDFSPIADFANPIKRKPKKGLDFSRWRELVPQDSSTVTQTTESGNSAAGECLKQNGARTQVDHVEKTDIDDQAYICDSPSRVHQGRDDSTGNSVDVVMGPSFALADKKVDESDLFPVQENVESEKTMFYDLSHRNFKNEHEMSCSYPVKAHDVSLESQIDVENQARLQEMSSSEIAEAQAELMEKMRPGVIEMLKKRGQKKLSNTKSVNSNSEGGRPLGTVNDKNNLNQASRTDKMSQEPMTVHPSALRPSGRPNGVSNDSVLEESGTPSKNSWNAWSVRVEAARTLRFALDGTVVESNFANVPGSGNVTDCSQRNTDTVAERDFLRTEGDPGAAGYTIKEAVALSRSTVPGQRTLALQLLTSVLDSALRELGQCEVDWNNGIRNDKFVDWEAVWAYALGPEPELALSVRMALDDNHISVILASVRALNSILCCDIVENLFDISERLAIYRQDLYTSPMFRSRPGIDGGFLHGGFWKYNAKPSNIIHIGDKMMEGEEEDEGQRTIQDDIFLAGQDFAAGLVRMGILPRICHLLETDSTTALEEYLISVLVGLARHSPTCASAIIRCPRLLQIIVERFTMKETKEIHPSKIKAITLLKVLAQSDKKNCIGFVEKGVFRLMMWHFYQHPLSMEYWIKSGREYCKLMSALMVEQLRFWRVCIQYGYCISYFPDFFPFLCLWLTPPNVENLIECNVLAEFASIAREGYLVLEALAGRLPSLHSEGQLKRQSVDSSDRNMEAWSWSHVSPMVDLALKWISLKSNSHVSKFISRHQSPNTAASVEGSFMSCFLSVISAVMHMLSSIVKKVVPESYNNVPGTSGRVPWLPEFVPKIGLEIIKNSYLNFAGTDSLAPSGGSFVTDLCDLRSWNNYELSLSTISWLHGLVELIVSLDKAIQLAKRESSSRSLEENSFSRDGKILEDGIITWSQDELRSVLVTFMISVSLGWSHVQSIDKFGRGGPAPGVGVGWGVSGGGFWSLTALVEQTEAHLLMKLQEIFPIVLDKDDPTIEDMTFTMQRINSVLGLSLTLGPRDIIDMEKAFDFLLQPTVLKYLDLCVKHFLPTRGIKAFGWRHKDEDHLSFSNILKSHFRNRWLTVKMKSKALDQAHDSDDKMLKKISNVLETIHEDLDVSDVSSSDAQCTSLLTEWAHQRLPLPTHWFLSAISVGPTGTRHDHKSISSPSDELLEVAKSGLFFLLGLEAMSSFLCAAAQYSPVTSVPLVWKLHSLSLVLLVSMGVLLEDKSRDTYSALQDLYGQLLDELTNSRNVKTCLAKNENIPENGNEFEVELLKFKSDVHESYGTFIEILVEHFGADSYSDVIYGRQVGMYLHLSVETPVRLATWNALSEANVLELLPPLANCFAAAEGYLGIESNEGILEAYAKSWASGSLDKAASRGSMSFALALHHLSSFIFHDSCVDKSVLRNKLAKSLLRDYSRKQQQHEGMMLELVHYNKAVPSQKHEWRGASSVQTCEVERRFRLLTEACEGSSGLLATVEKLKASLQNR